MSNEEATNPYYVRPRDEIEAAHDMIQHVASGKSGLGLGPCDRVAVMAHLDALCWILGHKNARFEECL